VLHVDRPRPAPAPAACRLRYAVCPNSLGVLMGVSIERIGHRVTSTGRVSAQLNHRPHQTAAGPGTGNFAKPRPHRTPTPQVLSNSSASSQSLFVTSTAGISGCVSNVGQFGRGSQSASTQRGGACVFQLSRLDRPPPPRIAAMGPRSLLHTVLHERFGSFGPGSAVCGCGGPR
jgi:hypothetical protein